MSASPSISLCLIAKNEERNVNRLLDSVKGCFDEIIFVDTGSTDKTKELAEARGCKVFDFTWIDDFSAARNFSFSKATSDYICWLDLDDELHNKEGFLNWKKTVMQFSDAYFATYHYALDADKKPIISFLRERVFKRSLNPTWQYPLHEGILIKPGWSMDYAVSWAVNHMRTIEDIKQDKSRNLNILKSMKEKGTLGARMQYYYGKELYENGFSSEALPEFEAALKKLDLEPHDRILALQYAGYSAQQMGDDLKEDLRERKNALYDRAISFAYDGLKLEPNRAEFNVMIGDCFLKRGEIHKALPAYAGAKASLNPKAAGSPYEGAIYSFINCYGEMPCLQMAKIHFNMGQMDEAEKECLECVEKYNNEEAKKLLEQIRAIKPLINIDNNQVETEDIVFTCPPNQAYPFDEEIYKTKPLGGSETALVQMARELKKQTGRPVKVFNTRDEDLVAESGVEYISNRKANLYFSQFRPKVNVAWRHNIRITKGKTYLWSHDLQTPGVEAQHNFDKHICLSSFHKDFVMGKQGLPGEKIWVSRNGIPTEKFGFERKPKDPNKVVWLSSPDRGLEQAIPIMDLVRKELPDVRLEIYYGWDGLYKYGPQMSALADRLKAMVAERPWIIYHGFVEQSQMYQEVSDAVVWAHPASFIETFCLTALETLANGIYPVTRRLGALANTLAEAESKGHATLLSHGGITPEEKQEYADEIVSAIKEEKWKRIDLNLENHSWGGVCREWVQEMGL